MAERKQYNTPDRMFVRGITGEYNLKDELARLRARPRVVRGRDLEYFNGPHVFGKHYLEPKDGLGQTLHIHLQEYAPGATSQKHGRFNRSTEKPARALVMKTKPMYLFMNMLFQRSIKKQSRDVHPNAVGYVPREEPHTADHAVEETLQEREMR